jgi:hypothetical protein
MSRNVEQAIETRSLQQRDVLLWFLGLAAVAGAASLALASPRFAASMGIGALLQLTNFRALWSSCEKILLVGGNGAGLAIATFSVRFVLLGLAVGIALWAGVDANGLVLGLSMIIPAAVVAAWRARPPILANAPALADDDPSWDLWSPWTAREREPADDTEEEGAMAIVRPDVGEDRAVHTFQVKDEENDS